MWILAEYLDVPFTLEVISDTIAWNPASGVENIPNPPESFPLSPCTRRFQGLLFLSALVPEVQGVMFTFHPPLGVPPPETV